MKDMKFVLLIVIPLLAACGDSSTAVTASDSNDPADAQNLVSISSSKLTIDDLVYQGAFRISSGDFGGSSVNYAVGTLAYNPDNHSIFIAGHAQQNRIAEFSIPELLMKTNVSDLNISTDALQDFRNILGAGTTGNPDGINRITGMYYKNGQLIVNAEQWYDAPGNNRDTTLVVRDAANLAASEIAGYYELQGRAQAAGYISEVPVEWQDKIGSSHITGWSNVYSIVSRYSVGPSLFSFNVNDLLDSTQPFSESVSTTPIMNFPFSGGEYLAPGAQQTSTGPTASAVWNTLSRGRYGFIVPNSKTFVVGSSAGIVGGIGYKIIQDNGNLCGGSCPAIASERYNYYWFFDVDEILDASRVSEPRPYAYGKWPLPFDNNGQHSIIGATFDGANKLLYIALGGAGQVGKYDRPPLILGYKINLEQ